MPDMTNWLRTYTMKFGPPGGAGLIIGNVTGPNQTALHINFSVEKSDQETCNTAKVQLWNLGPESLAMLEMKDCIVELKAGYAGVMAPVLVGTVVSVETELDGVDRMTEIEVIDGRLQLRDTYITASFNGPTPSDKVYDYVAGQIGTEIVYGPGIAHGTFPNGFSFIGKAGDCVAKVAQSFGHKWSMQNQILQIVPAGGYLTNLGFVISPETGLISIPKKITLGSKSDEKEENLNGYEIVYFLNGAIQINDIVRVQSKYLQGDFRIRKVTIGGDNMESDWTCVAHIVNA